MLFKKKHTPAPRPRQPTLERSAGASVFSYHASRAVRPGTAGRHEQEAVADGAVERRSQQGRQPGRKLVVACLVLLAAGAFINSVLRSMPTVTLAAGSKTAAALLRPQATYEAAAQAAFRDTWLNRSKMSVNTQRIETQLRAEFPELAAVQVAVPFIGSGLQVTLTPATPRLLAAVGPALFVVDDSGRVVSPAAQIPRVERLGLPVVTDQSGVSVVVGKRVLPASQVAYITEVVRQLQAKHIAIASLTLPAGTSELDIKVTGAPYTIKCNIRGDARVTVGTYLAVKAQLEHDKKAPGEYIDVRVEDRAYYK